MSTQPTKRPRQHVADEKAPTTTQNTSKRPANTAKTTQNATKSSQQHVQLPRLAAAVTSINSNLKQQQFDNIVNLKKKALSNPALFPIHTQEILAFCTLDNITLSPHELTTSLNALTAIYIHYIEQGSLYYAIPAIPKDFEKKVIEIEIKKTNQFQKFLKFISLIFRQDPNQNISLHKICWKLAFQIISTLAQKNSNTFGGDVSYNPLWSFLHSWLSSNILPQSIISEFYVTQLSPYDDLRYYTYQFLNTILPIVSEQAFNQSSSPTAAPSSSSKMTTSKIDLKKELPEKSESGLDITTTKHWTYDIPNCNSPTLRSNALALLSISKFALVTGKRWVKTTQVSTSMSDYSSKQRTILSNTWFTLLKCVRTGDYTRTIGYNSHLLHKDDKNGQKSDKTDKKSPIFDDVSIYTRIFAVMDTVILPNITQPLLLADFLTASFNLGGIISVQTLGAIFTLMQKHKLDYPLFFTQLYHICTLDILYSPYNIKFFSLLNMVLQGNYIPFYLVISFMKKLLRLSLFGPSTSTIYITALIFNLYRKHPMTAYLINRKATIVQGIAKNAQMSGDLLMSQMSGGDDLTQAITTTTTTTTTTPGITSSTQTSSSSLSSSSKTQSTIPSSSSSPFSKILSANLTPDQLQNDQNQVEEETVEDSSSNVNLFTLLKNNKTQKKMKKTDKFLSTLSLTVTPSTGGNTTTKPTVNAAGNGSIIAEEKAQKIKGKPVVQGEHITQKPDTITSHEIQSKWLNGQDPFIVDIYGLQDIKPENSDSKTSSLIELKDFMGHFLQVIRTNSKLLFDDNAPKHHQDISHLLVLLSFHTVIQQGLTYRAKHLIPTAFQKPLSLLGKAERIILADEKYDVDAKKRGELLDNERNTMETIFMW